MMKKLPVYYNDAEVGLIDVKSKSLTFTYDERWQNTNGSFPLSLSMPLAKKEHNADVVLPWLLNLLPEEDNLIALASAIGVSSQDVIAILERVGGDIAGAFQFGKNLNNIKPSAKIVETESDLEKIIEELPKKPFLIGEKGVSMSLAGAQVKLSVALIDNKIAIPMGGMPSTHILKPDNPRLIGSVQNEAFCLSLAKLCGLQACDVTTGIAGKRTYLLVNRYDRRQIKNGFQRLHQEDFCQAFGKTPLAKYQKSQSGTKGINLKDLFSVAEKHMTADDKIALFDYVVFNILICNTDSHAKNYSIMLSNKGAKLAPLYDLMCADVWDHITRKLPQKIAGKDNGEYLCGRHFKRMALECGFNETPSIKRIEMLANKALENIEEAKETVANMPAKADKMLDNVAEAVAKRCHKILSNLDK